jgi:hypothetical protein
MKVTIQETAINNELKRQEVEGPPPKRASRATEKRSQKQG